jgi:predicted hydrocarbon binding protein
MNTQPKMSEGLIEMLFGNEHCLYDLVGGKVTGVTDRVIYLTSDLIKGIYDSLVYEAGDAWSLIFKNCGYLWGKREIERLNKEIKIRMRKELGELSVGEFIDLIENYFSRQGWGVISIRLDDAETSGIVRVSFENSFFDVNLAETNGSANFMIAGILRAFFEHISQTDLDCVEVFWSRTGAKPNSELLISGSKRIEQLAQHISTTPMDIEEALGFLRAS